MKKYYDCRLLRKMFLLALLLGVVGMIAGCSSIIAGGHKTITVTSNPSGAHVDVLDGKSMIVAQGETPFSATIKRGDGYFKPAKHEFKASLPGKPSKVVGYKNGINAWYWGNILFGGIPGMLIVDPITGAMWEPPAVVNIDFNQNN